MPIKYLYNTRRDYILMAALLIISPLLIWFGGYSNYMQEAVLTRGLFIFCSIISFLYLLARAVDLIKNRIHWRLDINEEAVNVVYQKRTSSIAWQDINSVKIERIMVKVGVYEDFLQIAVTNGEDVDLTLQDFVISDINLLKKTIKLLCVKNNIGTNFE